MSEQEDGKFMAIFLSLEDSRLLETLLRRSLHDSLPKIGDYARVKRMISQIQTIREESKQIEEWGSEDQPNEF